MLGASGGDGRAPAVAVWGEMARAAIRRKATKIRSYLKLAAAANGCLALQKGEPGDIAIQ